VELVLSRCPAFSYPAFYLVKKISAFYVTHCQRPKGGSKNGSKEEKMGQKRGGRGKRRE